MEHVAFFCAVVLIVSSVAVSIWTVRFALAFFRPLAEPVGDERLPRVAVLMGMKGTDPYLLAGLKRLMQQDYPDYLIRLVIDTRDDPAWEVAEQAIRETGSTNVSIEEFRDVPEHGIVNCTNSKVVQALRGLPEDACDVVAMADGDVVADEHWLRNLVTPLVHDERIGVTTGNRWFTPAQGRLGSIVRQIWNVAATSIMYTLNMPWGGCYAIRMSTIRDGGLIDKWARVAALDMCTTRELKKLGQKVHFVPSLMMVNREDCGLPFCVNFVRRQITWARLYNPGWPLIVLHTVLTTLSYVVSAGLIPFTAGIGLSHPTLFWSVMGVATYTGSMFALVLLMEYAIRQRLRTTSQTLVPLTAMTLLKFLVAIPLTAVVQLLATLMTTFQRKVAWRGLILDIRGPHDIRTTPIDQPASEPISEPLDEASVSTAPEVSS